MELSLAKSYEKYFKIGAAISDFDVPVYSDLLKQHFNSLTCENEMKYEPIHPEEGRYNFGPADTVANFARENGIKMRAHAPVWHTQTPAWMFDMNGRLAPRELIFERLEEHIKTFAERYNDIIYCWDVVNEATVDYIDEWAKRFGRNEVYRQTQYLTTCGVEYLEKAFFLARKYSPNTQLFYNDYNECDPMKRERIYTLMKNLLDRGAPLQGFGMQTHYNIYNVNYDEVKISIEKYASLGLRLHITEMDISFYNGMGPDLEPIKEFTPEMMAKQDEIYEKLFEIYRSYSDVIDCVTTWGVADDRSWLSHPSRPNRPLLFNADHSPKKCVYNMIEAAK